MNAHRRARRRRLLALAGASAFLWPFATRAQRVSRVGFFSGGYPAAAQDYVVCLKDGLRELGWVEGKNVVLEFKWSEGAAERLPGLAKDLLALKPDVILSVGTPASQAIHRATRDIPVVFVAVSDPVASGLVASLARPGGNVTGVSNFLPGITGKLLELLKAVAPGVARVAVLHDPANNGKLLEVKILQTTGKQLGVAIEPVAVRTAADVDRAFSDFAATANFGVVTLLDAITNANRARIARLAADSKLPSIYQIRDFVKDGGLMSYGLNLCEHYKRSATYVSKVLKGAKPTDLPVELPTSFELVINLKTAKAIGIAIPNELLLRADEVIR